MADLIVLRSKKVDQWSTFFISFSMQLQMHEFFFLQQIFFRLSEFWIVYAAVYWTYRRTLRLIVKTNTFGTFLVRDVIDIHVDRFKSKISRYFFTVERLNHAL